MKIELGKEAAGNLTKEGIHHVNVNKKTKSPRVPCTLPQGTGYPARQGFDIPIELIKELINNNSSGQINSDAWLYEVMDPVDEKAVIKTIDAQIQ